MKKLIALFAVTTMASAGALATVDITGAASVSYDDNGSATSATTYDADISMVGTAGATTVTIGMDVDTRAANDYVHVTGVDMSTTIGPVTIAADMFDEVSATTASGGQTLESVDTGVTISLDVPVGDATVGLDNSGNVTLTGTWSGVTLSHTVGDTTSTTASAAIAGMDMSVTNKAGATTWTLDTTVSGIDLTLTSAQKVTAAFGLAGNIMTVTAVPAVAAAAAKTGCASGSCTNGYGTNAVTAAKKHSTVAISRDLTSGATLTATYSTLDDSMTLKAAVTF